MKGKRSRVRRNADRPRNGSRLVRKLLLLCEGQGKIVFAHGDCELLNHKIKEVMHKDLFSLGFTESSLCSLTVNPRGILSFCPQQQFTLQVANLRPEAPSEQTFNSSKGTYIKRLNLNCSLTRATFEQNLTDKQPCFITVVDKVSMLDIDPPQLLLALVLVTPLRKDDSAIYSTYQDYCQARSHQHKSQKVKIEEPIVSDFMVQPQLEVAYHDEAYEGEVFKDKVYEAAYEGVYEGVYEDGVQEDLMLSPEPLAKAEFRVEQMIDS